MVHPNLSQAMMSESIEMYLLRIALMQEEGKLVPISQLAQELAISPVSTHEMCRKLTEKDLIRYEPYKGVALTTEGENVARKILRRRRLWEVFLVEKLGIEAHEAETIACQLEHVDLQNLTERLAVYLGNPTLSPQQEIIPGSNDSLPGQDYCSLASLAVGQSAQVALISADAGVTNFLSNQGLNIGVNITVLAIGADGSLLLQAAGEYLSVAPAIVAQIEVIPLPETEKIKV